MGRDLSKYLGCVLDESGTDDAECCRKVASERKVAGVITSHPCVLLGVCSLSVRRCCIRECPYLFC